MKVVVSEFVSVDGVMQAPGANDEDTREGFEHGGWQLELFDEALGAFVMAGIDAAGGLLLGRRTYEIFASYWPFQPDDDPIAPTFNAMPKHVASRTLSEPLEWANSKLLGDDVPGAIQRLRDEPGGDLLIIGSGNLIRTLVEHGLVDEYRLMVHPLILGTGRRLFDGETTLPRTALRLAGSETTPNGVVVVTYHPVAETAVADGEGAP